MRAPQLLMMVVFSLYAAMGLAAGSAIKFGICLSIGGLLNWVEDTNHRRILKRLDYADLKKYARVLYGLNIVESSHEDVIILMKHARSVYGDKCVDSVLKDQDIRLLLRKFPNGLIGGRKRALLLAKVRFSLAEV